MALSRRSRFTALTTTIIGIACGGGGGGGGGTPPAQNTLSKAPTSGDGQVVNAGQVLPNPLAVIVKDASGNPVSGVTITWAPTLGGGTVGSGSSTTAASGIATMTLTTGSDSVVQNVTASGANLTGSPVTFTATARIQGATQIALNAGNGQTDTVLATLPTAYSVMLRNEVGAAVSGVTVTWSAAAGSVNGSGTTTTTSSPAGIDTVSRQLGSVAGTQTALATVRGLIGSPVTFTATALPGIPTQITKNGGDAQTGAINSPLPVPRSVLVRDGHGNGVPMVPVTWVVGVGGGSVSPTSTQTGTNGVASTTRTLGTTLGTQTDTATTTGLAGSPVAFTATGALAVQVGDIFFRSAHNGSQNPAVDTIPAGATVIWTWVGSLLHNVESTVAPSFASSSIMTGAGKTYSVTFTTGGTYTYNCVVHGALMTGRVVVQ
jgi:plastocyanin